MTYKIKENAKNVWIRDNENTQDLSPLTDANSVYFNSGRTLEQELGKGAMESNVVTINSTMSKVIDEAYDGVYESCVFKGKSLVNLVRNTGTKLFGTSGLGKINRTETSHGMIYETSREDLNTYITIRTGANPMMKPNTSYTIFFEIVQNTIIKDGQSYKGVTVCGTNDSYYDRATNRLYHNSNFSLDKGIKTILVTTGSDVSSYDGFGFGFPSFSSGGVEQGQVFEIQNVMVIEGDCTNQDIPYFEGLCDVKMPILRNVGKNLLDPQTFIPLDKGVEYVRYEDGYVLANFTNANTHFFYKVDLARLPKGMYTVIAKHEGERSYLGIQLTFKDGTKTWGKTQFNNDGSYAELGLYMQSTTNDPSLKVKAKIMLVANGDTTSPYEDYKTNILRTSEEIVLREVSGVQDTYNPLTGEYTKRIGEKVLCGETAEDWRDFRNTFIEKTETIDVYLINPEQRGNSNLLCDKMRTTSKGTYMNDEEGISCSGGSGLNIWVSIFKNKLSTPNKEGFKQWLQSNPITVQYELEAPVTTIVEPSTIPFIYQNGHIILESGYKGQSLTPILEYTASVSRTGQVENVAKTIQRHETQLTLLEKMLIGNIIELDYNNTLMALNLKMDEVK